MNPRATTDAPHITPLTVTVPEAAALLGIGATQTRALIRSGRLPVVRFGRSVRVARTTLERLLAESEAAELAVIKDAQAAELARRSWRTAR